MKKLSLFGIVFLALALIASPAIAKELPTPDNDAVGNFNFKMAITDSQPGDNIGFLIRGISKEELKSLIDDGDNVSMLVKAIHELNGAEIGGRKIVKNGAAGPGTDVDMGAAKAVKEVMDVEDKMDI